MSSDIFTRTKKLLRANSPQILAGFGVAGVLTTAYYAAKGSFQAADLIREEEAKSGTASEPTERLKERAKLVWPCYIPAATTGVVTIGCIVGSNSLHTRRAAAAVSAWTLTEQAFTEYRSKVRNELGEHKEQVLRDDIVRERMDQNPPKEGVVLVGDGGVLCHELYTGRYFMSSMEKLRRAQNDANQARISDLYVALDEFYDSLGWPHTAESGSVGWDGDRALELEFTTTMTEDGQPCLAFNYNYVKPL